MRAGGTDRDVAEVESALSARDVDVLITRVASVSARRGQLPAAAVVVGAELTPGIVDALRHLAPSEIPVMVMVTGLTDRHEALLLAAGAFDVVSLPASPVRIGGRTAALLRQADRHPRYRPGERHLLADGAVDLRTDRRELRVNGTQVHLTRSEFELLVALARGAGGVVSRRELVDALPRSSSPSTLGSHLSRLRIKIQQAGGPPLVESVRGVGYRLYPQRTGAPPKPGTTSLHAGS